MEDDDCAHGSGFLFKGGMEKYLVMGGKGLLGGGGGCIWKLGRKGFPTNAIMVCG